MSDGWAMKSIGELCEAPKLLKAEVGTIPYIEIGDVDVVSKLVNLKDKPAVKGSVLAPANSLLVSRVRPTRGAITLLNGAQAVSSAFLALQPSAGTNLKLLFYWLAYSIDFRTYLEGAQIGSLYPSVREEDILRYRMNYPSDPNEQQRIVRLLDEAFEGIAIAKANAEKNLQNARALFESQLQFIFTKGGIGWADRPLFDLCSVFEDGDWIESKDQSSGGIRLIQTGNVGKGVFKDRAGKARFISEETFKALRCSEIFAGDCLVSRLPDPVGRSCIIPSTTERMITAVDCTILRFKKDVLIPEYFVYYSQSSGYLSSIAKLCTGTTRNRISRSNLGGNLVPVPTLKEQRAIIEDLKQIEHQIQALEATYSTKLTALEGLSKSLLSAAFAGKLKAA